MSIFPFFLRFFFFFAPNILRPLWNQIIRVEPPLIALSMVLFSPGPVFTAGTGRRLSTLIQGVPDCVWGWSAALVGPRHLAHLSVRSNVPKRGLISDLMTACFAWNKGGWMMRFFILHFKAKDREPYPCRCTVMHFSGERWLDYVDLFSFILMLILHTFLHSEMVLLFKNDCHMHL